MRYDAARPPLHDENELGPVKGKGAGGGGSAGARPPDPAGVPGRLLFFLFFGSVSTTPQHTCITPLQRGVYLAYNVCRPPTLRCSFRVSLVHAQ